MEPHKLKKESMEILKLREHANTLVIVPAFNEEGNLPGLLHKLRLLQPGVDILVIDDCSSDQTAQVCRDLEVNVIRLPCNLGIGGAVQTGYKYADLHGYDFAIQVDGDGQHDPGQIDEMMRPLRNGQADLVIGSRYINKTGFQSSAIRRLGIRYFSLLIKLLTRQTITDPTSGFRACNAKVIRGFSRFYPVDYPEPESAMFIKRNGLTIVEVPVDMHQRQAGESSIHSFASIYYLVKVSLAILIDRLRKQGEVGG